MRKIGTVETLYRYPVKSMQGEKLAEAYVAFSGVHGDRVYAFVDNEKKRKNNFPWFSAREKHDLILYRPRFLHIIDTDYHYPDANNYAVEVITPEGECLPIDSHELLAKLRAASKFDFELRFSEKGMQDARPISIFSLNTTEALSQETSREIDPRRFRANFYVRWDDPTPFSEDELVGRTLRIGERLELHIVKKDPRCVIITLDPETAAVHPEVLRNIAKKHQGCAGIYAAVLKDGMAKVGDEIFLV